MSNRTTLKNYFLTNLVPTQSQFADLIESGLMQPEDSIRKQGDDPISLQAQPADLNGTQQLLHFYKNFNSADAAWKCSLLSQATAGGLNIGSSTVQSSLFIKDADGSIGIGTTNPLAKLHINNGNIVVNGNVGIGVNTPQFPLSFPDVIGNKISLWGQNPNAHFGFGIVDGGLTIHTDANTSDVIFGYGSNATNTPLAAETMRIKGTGGVGIGTSSPGAQLHIAGTNDFNAPRGSMVLSRYWASANDTRASAIFHYVNNNIVPSGDQLVFAVSGDSGNNNSPVSYGNAKMVIQANGNIGIGNTTPQARLQVTGGNALFDGNVGIGITVPTAKFHVNGGNMIVTGGSIVPSLGNTINNGIYFTGDPAGGGGDNAWIRYRAANYNTNGTAVQDDKTVLEIGTSNDNDDHIFLNPSGNVGIGTSSPTAKLHVVGFIQKDYKNIPYGSLHNGGAAQENNPNTNNINISILASDRVVATEFDATSDARIKKECCKNNSAADLDKLTRIKITEFFYKDEIQYGKGLQKGVIAQELEEIFPQAVSYHADFIPDIYALPQSASTKDFVLILTMRESHNLQSEDIVRLVTASGAKEVKITKVDDYTFMVSNWREESTDIFVYGKQVDDFRTVNYNSIFCLGISAIQELHKQLQVLKKEVSDLKNGSLAASAPAA